MGRLFSMKPGFQSGSSNGNSKLGWKQVEEIRARYEQGGITYGQLSKKYKVAPGTIGKIVRNEIWVSVE